MSTRPQTGLHGVALDAWRGYLLSHAAISRELDAALLAKHELTARDYEVLLFLAHEPERRLAMSELATRTMLTRSGVTRLVDGLTKSGLLERVSCPSDLRVSYAQLTDEGYERLRAAGPTHIESVRTAFLQYFSEDEVEVLAGLMSRLPGVGADDAPDCSVE